MFKNALKGLIVLLGMVFIFGCTATKDVEVRRYIEVKDRVDQNMEDGNAGFIGGTPIPEDRSNIRKTRKIYVLEVSKEANVDEDMVMVEDADQYVETQYNDAMDQEPENVIRVPRDARPIYDYYDPDVNANADISSARPDEFTEYTVQKDDTLQKISKKFYDSYSKWPKIYDANRGVLDNQDSIKPGTVIRIPSLK